MSQQRPEPHRHKAVVSSVVTGVAMIVCAALLITHRASINGRILEVTSLPTMDLLSTPRHIKTFSTMGQRDGIYPLAGGLSGYMLNGYYSLTLGSGVDSVSQYSRSNETIVGVLPALFSRSTDTALVVGAGTGLTASAAAAVFRSATVVDLDPNIPDILRYLADYNGDLLHQPSVTLIQDSALAYITASREHYDAIISTPTVPSYVGASEVYSVAFLEAVKSHLNPGGVYTLWLDTRFSPLAVRIIAKTVGSVFPYHAWLPVSGGYFELMASTQPISKRRKLSALHLNARVHTNISSYLGRRSEGQSLASYIDSHQTRFRVPTHDATPINTLNHPVLRYHVRINALPVRRNRKSRGRSQNFLNRTLVPEPNHS